MPPTLQTASPLDHLSLNPSFMTAAELVKWIDRGELTLDPPYQRGSVWELDQRRALVHTWLRGLPAGVVILADRCAPAWAEAHPDTDPNTHPDEAWWACVDGKQRLTTAVEWVAGKFAVPASWFPADHVDTTEDTPDGPYVRYPGLSDMGRRFMDRYASLLVAKVKDCATLADEAAFYLVVNGGGTPQSAADMGNAARIAGDR